MTLYLSTGGFGNVPATERAASLVAAGIGNIELSGGSFSSTWRAELSALSSTASLILHNYCPVPTRNFVLNIASPRADIANLSMQHYRQSIDLSAELGAKFYGIHAGMAVDPLPSQLGQQISQHFSDNDRFQAQSRFQQNVVDLAEHANAAGVQLLVENHVLIPANLIDGRYSLLLVEPDEIKEFFSQIQGAARLLLDVGHLRVSANTLGFSEREAYGKLSSFIGGLHLHANSGSKDEHLCFESDEDFLSYVDLGMDYITLEIVSNNIEDVVRNYRWMDDLCV